MPNPIRFVLALHNHQPVGNFDEVFQRAYDDSYRPFLEVLEPLPVAQGVAARQRLADGMAGGPSARVHRPAGGTGRARADRDSRRGVVRADPADDPLLGPRRADPRLHPLAAKPAGGHGPRPLGRRNASGSSPAPATWSTPASSTPCWTTSTSAAPGSTSRNWWAIC